MSKSKTILDFFVKKPAIKSSPLVKSYTADSPLRESSIVKSTINPITPNVETPLANRKTFSTAVDNSLNSTPKSTRNIPKRKTIDIDDDLHSDAEAEDEIPISKPKRKRIVLPSDSDDSVDEYKPGKDEEDEISDSITSDLSDEDIPNPKKKKLKRETSSFLSNFKSPKASLSESTSSSHAVSTPKNCKQTSRISKITPSKKGTSIVGKKQILNDTANKNSEESIMVDNEIEKEWTHENLDWLKDDKIKDKYGHHKSDPEYNPRTLYVPESFKKNLTPALKQWWDMKVDHFDTILFFKVGKFYELYHMDAVVGVKELGLVYMKGDFAHSGFPEIAYGRYSEVLVEKGYKVARIEQTETPQMMEERVKKLSRPTKFDKVVAREICQITTKGTRVLNYQGGPMIANNNYLLAICEKQNYNSDSGSEYGICFVDTSVGKFTLGQFEDDRHGSRILTMTALYPPVEILYERTTLSKKTLQLLNNNLNYVSKEALNTGSQFWNSVKTLKFLTEEGYFKSDNDSIILPEAIQLMLDPNDQLQQTPLKQCELALKSLGACIWYLKECCIEDNLLSMKLFEEYKPVDGIQISHSPKRTLTNQHMVLDGITLNNLEIVPVRPSDSTEGTLMGSIDSCSTYFGKRLLRHWLCSPLFNPDSINDRLNAVEDLMQIPEIVEAASIKLKKIPDLERLLSKIHSQALSHSKNHPESRAIYYEADIYNKRKLLNFLSTLSGFKESIEIISLFESCIFELKSKLLKECISTSKNGGHFPEMKKILEFFDEAFDHEVAKKEGNIIPNPGVDSEYDMANSNLKDVESDIENHLEEMKTKLNCKVSYVGSGRTRYQLEVPDHKKVPDYFEFQSARKGFKRYYSSEERELLSRMIAAEEARSAALKDVARRIFAQFDNEREMWKSAVYCLSVLDVLISFCSYYKSSEVDMCRPQFSLSDENTEPFIEILDGKHPTFLKYFTGSNYIPNNLYLGPKQEDKKDEMNSGGRLVLVTGPNMGGKSTLMRQAGTLVIMAQVGTFVPATSMKLTPVDRIFTRVGANDQIEKGESTFFVEASETSCILHNATPDSFVLIDELGRGTSTHDGTAIAYAVLKYLANKICCRTLFSTHYHSLVEDFHTHPSIGLGHMACMVEKDNACPEMEKITFLYKFIDGSCPKSYGFNVALLAGIPKQIVQKSIMKAHEMENSVKISKNLKKLLSTKTPEELLEKVRCKIENL